MTDSSRPRVAILLNLVAPYRAALFDHLSNAWDLHVLWTGWEDNRGSWPQTYENRAWALRKVSGWVFRRSRKTNGRRFHTEYLHVPIGVPHALLAVQPDLVLTWEMGIRTLLALLYGQAARVPVWICWESPADLANRGGWLRRRLRRWCFAHAAGWVSFSRAATAYLEAQGARRVVQVQNTVDDQVFASVRSDRLQRGKDQADGPILFVGQLLHRKGVDVLIEAVRRTKGLTLDVIGEGPEGNRLEALAAGLPVRFLGAASQDDLLGAFRSARALVLPSREEVWGLVINEAILAGVPVAASCRTGAGQELLPAAALFDPDDPSDVDRVLALAIRGTLPPPEFSAVMTLRSVAQEIVMGLT